MTAQQAVARYYEAWRSRRGDMSRVPLADGFRFLGPVASFETSARRARSHRSPCRRSKCDVVSCGASW